MGIRMAVWLQPRYRQAVTILALVYAVGYAMGNARGRVVSAHEILELYARPGTRRT